MRLQRQTTGSDLVPSDLVMSVTLRAVIHVEVVIRPVEWLMIAESVTPVGTVYHVVVVSPPKSSAIHCELVSVVVVDLASIPGTTLVAGILKVQIRPT